MARVWDIKLILGSDGQPTSAEGVRRMRRDADQNRVAVLEAARRLVDRCGADWTVADVADEASVGKGTVYRHYPDVGALCSALLDDDSREVQSRAMAIAVSGEPALRRADRILDDLLSFTQRNRALLCRAGRNRSAAPDRPRHAGAGAFHRMSLLTLLREAARAGDLHPDVTPEYAVDALLAALDPALIAYQEGTVGLSSEQIRAGLRRLLAGLAAPP